MKEKTERNKAIQKYYRKGDGGRIGDVWGISRQRVWQIKEKKLGFWRRLWKLISTLKIKRGVTK